MAETAVRQGWLWGQYSALGLIVALATFAIDQAHKWWMLYVYDIAEKGRVTITSFFDLVFVKNTGISYSLFSMNSMQGQYLLAAFAAFASLCLWGWLARSCENRVVAWALGFIIGGALGNALDRLLIGGVADFFDFHAFGYNWYVFNIADVAIVAGVALLLYDSIRSSRNDAAKSL